MTFISRALAERIYREANAERWRIPVEAFTATLEAACAQAFSAAHPGEREIARHLSSLHLEDLALACACAQGDDAAWEQFILEMRPALYRAADALDPTGGARELADSLYAELFGIEERGGVRRSLLRYYHGRSRLTTWLRAVLAQRYVDRVRVVRRYDELDDDLRVPSIDAHDAECPGLVAALTTALERAMAALDARDRLRLKCYYAQELTLAQTGRLLKESEATVSRQLSRTRVRLRDDVERELRATGLTDARVARCFECASKDVGPLNIDRMLDVQEIEAGSFKMKGKL